MIKILAPISRFEDIDPLANIGVDEFFFGFSATDTNDVNCLNLRPYNDANFTDLKELAESLSKIKTLKKKSYLCLNADFYTDHETQEVFNLLKKVSRSLTGVIVSDFLIISTIKNRYPNIKIISSTRAKIYNSASIKFYSQMGIDRMTMPISLTLNEMSNMVRNNSALEFEAFVKNESCKNINGLCGLTHNSFENRKKGLCVFCKYPRSFKLCSINGDRASKIIEKYFDNLHLDYECGVCKIKDLYNMGIYKFKIAGRNTAFDKKIKDAYFVAEARRRVNLDKRNYRKQIMDLYKETYNKPCNKLCLYL